LERAKALQILWMGHWCTARRLSEIFGEADGDQYEGFGLIHDACDAVGISQDKFYEMQREYLDLRSELLKKLDELLDKNFNETFGEPPPTYQDVFKSTEET
jgi:hypothetical protein